MKETPLLMRGPLVVATLEDRKTETRRVVDIKKFGGPSEDHASRGRFHCEKGLWRSSAGNYNVWSDGRPCPYGKPGDRIWVKETHWLFGRWYEDGLTKKGRPRWRFRADRLHRFACFTPGHVTPRRTSKGWHKRPSIFMPRWASRLTLEIVSIRVERLQQISEKDCFREGVSYTPAVTRDHRIQFIELWDSINGKEHPWASNPWVWVIAFKRIGKRKGARHKASART